MTLKSRWLRLAILLTPGLLGAGCSGINATGTMSPATFFLPGLGQTQRPAPASPVPLPPAADLLLARSL
jgi:hypothetical protein